MKQEMENKLKELGIDTKVEIGSQFRYNRDNFAFVYECVDIKKESTKSSDLVYYFEPNPKKYIFEGKTYPYMPCSMKIEFLYDFLLRNVWQRVTTK